MFTNYKLTPTSNFANNVYTYLPDDEEYDGVTIVYKQQNSITRRTIMDNNASVQDINTNGGRSMEPNHKREKDISIYTCRNYV